MAFLFSRSKFLELLTSIFLLLAMIGVASWYMLGTTKGAKIIMGRVLEPYVGRHGLHWAEAQGNIVQGLMIRNLELRDIRFLPVGNVVRVQDFKARLSSLGLNGLEIEFANARLLLPQDDPLVVDGKITGGKFYANAYTRTFNLSRVKDFIPGFKHLSAVKGDFKDVDFDIEGVPEDFTVKGKAVVERWRYGVYVLEECPFEQDLHYTKTGMGWQLSGKILIKSGSFVTPHAKVKIAPSRLYFSGDPLSPSLDVKGQARVSRTKIDIAVKGTRNKPEVTLSSDPALPQEQLLLLLATGKRWSGMTSSSTQQKMSPELAGDFVDYFLFGGAGKKVAQYFGLSDISFKLDQNKQGVMVNKDVSDRIGVGYGVEVTTAPNEPRELKQTVQGEYDVTEKITVGVQKEVAGAVDPAVQSETPKAATDDRVYMKYKTQF